MAKRVYEVWKGSNVSLVEFNLVLLAFSVCCCPCTRVAVQFHGVVVLMLCLLLSSFRKGCSSFHGVDAVGLDGVDGYGVGKQGFLKFQKQCSVYGYFIGTILCHASLMLLEIAP
ncbi:hypothetical protein C3L33_18253, partial [Rhododendron williamsianum]